MLQEFQEDTFVPSFLLVLSSMKSKPDLNKYDKKDTGVTKETIVIRNSRKEKSQGFFIRVTFHSFLRVHILHISITLLNL